MKSFKFNQEESKKLLAKFFICVKLPFCAIKPPIFSNFMKSVQPLFNVIDHKIVRSDCTTLHQEERKKKDAFKRISCQINFTNDIWTSN